MKTIWNDEDRTRLLDRVDRITDDSKPLWGRMMADRMLSHLVESAKMATGEIECKSKMLPIRWFPLKQLILYVFPFPKGAPTAPELLAGAKAPVADLKPELRRLIDKFAARADRDDWPRHPAFGKLSRDGWGALTYKHFDHHLRQFQV